MTLKWWGLFLMLAANALPADSATRILVHGHRGARAMRPENTIPAFRYAIEVGVDVLELDLAVTKDNVLVVSHDPLLNPKICKGPEPGRAIHTLTFKELTAYDCGALPNPEFPNQSPIPGTRVPTLDEVLSLSSQGTFDFNIETKIFPDKPELAPAPEAFARLVLDAVHKHKLESRVIIQSFDFRTLHELKKIAPEIRLSALYSGASKSFVEIATAARATIISPHFSLITKQQVEAAHRAGLLVVPWTANTPAEWRPLVEAGVDAIISDDPALLKAFLSTH